MNRQFKTIRLLLTVLTALCMVFAVSACKPKQNEMTAPPPTADIGQAEKIDTSGIVLSGDSISADDVKKFIFAVDDAIKKARAVSKDKVLKNNGLFATYALQNYSRPDDFKTFLSQFFAGDLYEYVLSAYEIETENGSLGFTTGRPALVFAMDAGQDISILEQTGELIRAKVPFAYDGIFDVTPQSGYGTVELKKDGSSLWKITKISHWYNDYIFSHTPKNRAEKSFILYEVSEEQIQKIIKDYGTGQKGNLLSLAIKRGEDDYILPDSSAKLLTQSDVKPLTKYELYFARNEIYARHGAEFSEPDLSGYFSIMPWYQPSVSMDKLDSSVLGDIEKKNVEFLKKQEQTR